MRQNSDLLQSLRSLSESQRRRSLPPPDSLPELPERGFLWRMWSPSSTVIAILIVLTAVGLLGLLRASWRHTVDPMIHDQYAGSLRSLRTLDSALNEAVLRSSAGLLPNQDSLVQVFRLLRVVARELATGTRRAPYLSAEGSAEVQKSVRAFVDTLSLKEQQIERFKSESAVLRNSQNYFPLAVRSFVEQLVKEPSATLPASTQTQERKKRKRERGKTPIPAVSTPQLSLGSEVEALLHQVSLFSLQPLPEYVPQIDKRLSGLESAQSSLSPSLREDLRLIISHARIIVDRQHRIDDSVRAVLSFPTRERAESARRHYDKHFHEALSRADSYRLWASLLSVLLVILSASLLILKLRRSALALAQEREVAEKLLLNVLPKPIAERLKLAPDVIADSFPTVTVLFADLVGFSQLSSRLPAIDLVKLLNRIFSALDLLAEHYGLEKIKTIGDAYMVVSGLPIARPDHAEAMAEFALAALEEMERIRAERGDDLQFRIGINTGAVVAGVIGLRKFAYDLWGDTVNVASRMEMHGLPGAIQCSESTHKLLRDRYEFTARGAIAVKGIGPMQTFVLVRPKTGVSA
jgi:class 3 adenylate cyclase